MIHGQRIPNSQFLIPNFRAVVLLALFVCAGALVATSASAQSNGEPASAGVLTLPADYAGPPAPTLPESMARDAEGRTTIRAVRLTAPLKIDGRLDEPLYQDVRPIRDFIQTEPRENVPATETTEVWLAFDRDNVYVSFRCARPPGWC
jgi:hypothetical protein